MNKTLSVIKMKIKTKKIKLTLIIKKLINRVKHITMTILLNRWIIIIILKINNLTIIIIKIYNKITQKNTMKMIKPYKELYKKV